MAASIWRFRHGGSPIGFQCYGRSPVEVAVWSRWPLQLNGADASDGGFLSHRGTPSHHPFRCDFPWNKPSSYWGSPIYGNPHIGTKQCGFKHLKLGKTIRNLMIPLSELAFELCDLFFFLQWVGIYSIQFWTPKSFPKWNYGLWPSPKSRGPSLSL